MFENGLSNYVTRVTTMYWYGTLWPSEGLGLIILWIFLMSNNFYGYWVSVKPKKNVSSLHTASVICRNIIIVNSSERPFWHTQKIGFNQSVFWLKGIQFYSKWNLFWKIIIFKCSENFINLASLVFQQFRIL